MDRLNRFDRFCWMALIFSIAGAVAWGIEEALDFRAVDQRKAFQYYLLITWLAKVQMGIEIFLGIMWSLHGEVYLVKPLVLIPVILLTHAACSTGVRGWRRASHYLAALSLLLIGMIPF